VIGHTGDADLLLAGGDALYDHDAAAPLRLERQHARLEHLHLLRGRVALLELRDAAHRLKGRRLEVVELADQACHGAQAAVGGYEDKTVAGHVLRPGRDILDALALRHSAEADAVFGLQAHLHAVGLDQRMYLRVGHVACNHEVDIRLTLDLIQRRLIISFADRRSPPARFASAGAGLSFRPSMTTSVWAVTSAGWR
jgi:hypothetical protein